LALILTLSRMTSRALSVAVGRAATVLSKMVNWRPTVALALEAFTGFTSPVSPERQMPSPVGCYRLHLGPWSRLLLLAAHPDSAQMPPAAFQLDSAVVDSNDPNIRRLRHAAPKNPAVKARGPWPSWYVTGLNTLHVIWSTGFIGVELNLVQQGDTLRGVAEAFTDSDVGVPRFLVPSATATAVRIPCGQMPTIWTYAR
jgi:hypothetical protein